MKIAPGGGQSDEEEGDDDGEEALRANEEMLRMQKLMEELDNPQYGHVVKQTLESLSTTKDGVETVDNLFDQLQAPLANQHPLMAFPTDPMNPNVEFTDRNIAGPFCIFQKCFFDLRISDYP